MKIRRAQPLDIPQIFDIALEMQRRGAFQYTKMNFSAITNRCLDAIHNPNMWLGVAEHEGKIVGALMLIYQRYWWTKDEYFVIDDGIFSSRAGAGVWLVRAGVKWAMSKSPKEITICINSDIDLDKTVQTLDRLGLRARGINVSMRLDTAEARQWAA